MEDLISMLAGYLQPIKEQIQQSELLWAVIVLLLYSSLLAIRELRKEKEAHLKTKEELNRVNVQPDSVAIEDNQRISDAVKVETQLEVLSEVAQSTIADLSSEHTVSGGLSKTRSKFFSGLRRLFESKSTGKEQLLAALEELLISSDIGVKTTQVLLEKFRAADYPDEMLSFAAIRQELKNRVVEILNDQSDPLIEPKKVGTSPKVIVVVGVNGVGKTTTIGKLAAQFRVQGANVLIGACDTFRAAAGAQLEEWARRADAQLVQGAENAKPTTVAYETVTRGIKEGVDVIILDTAGRLHTKVNLMNELAAVVKLVERELPGAPHETILVLDASTGQNAVQQAREFHGCVDLTGIVVTKLDGTPKGGVVVAIKEELKTPIRYIGIGEGLGDLRPFSAEEFVNALFEEGSLVDEESMASEHGEVRRRKRRVAN